MGTFKLLYCFICANITVGSYNNLLPVPMLVVAFNVVQIIGLVMLGAVLLTACLVKDVKRSSAWYLFMATWLFYTAAHLLLAGQQIGPNPMFGLCLFQASLIYSTPVLFVFPFVCKARHRSSGLLGRALD